MTTTEELIMKFCDNQIKIYSHHRDYKDVTYNIGYTDAMLRVREFILKNRTEKK